MNLFGNPSQPQPSGLNEQRDEASRRSIVSGGLPLNAMDRLRDQASRQGKPGQCFTSDLSVNELAAIADAGYEPLGQVMGSAIYHIGWQYIPNYSWSSGELQVITEAYHNARHLALSRIQQEASLLNATDVAGVRLELRQYEWGVGLLEFTAFGSAIRRKTAPPNHAAPSMSLLSGQELWLLDQAGYHPVGVATGNCSWCQAANWNTIMATQSTGFGWGSAFQNQELTDYTQAIYQARSLASLRMEMESRGLGAKGVIGVTIQTNMEMVDVGDEQNPRKDMIVHFATMGTAIASLRANLMPLPLDIAVTLKDK